MKKLIENIFIMILTPFITTKTSWRFQQWKARARTTWIEKIKAKRTFKRKEKQLRERKKKKRRTPSGTSSRKHLKKKALALGQLQKKSRLIKLPRRYQRSQLTQNRTRHKLAMARKIKSRKPRRPKSMRQLIKKNSMTIWVRNQENQINQTSQIRSL